MAAWQYSRKFARFNVEICILVYSEPAKDNNPFNSPIVDLVSYNTCMCSSGCEDKRIVQTPKITTGYGAYSIYSGMHSDRNPNLHADTSFASGHAKDKMLN